jgi:hypothetical protein
MSSSFDDNRTEHAVNHSLPTGAEVKNMWINSTSQYIFNFIFSFCNGSYSCFSNYRSSAPIGLGQACFNLMRGLGFTCPWRFKLYSGLWCRVVMWSETNVSHDHIDSIFRVGWEFLDYDNYDNIALWAIISFSGTLLHVTTCGPLIWF